MNKIIDKISQGFFSMKSMTLAILVFAGSIAAATFIESFNDVQASKVLIYNSLWFEFLLVYLSINLISNIIKYRLIQQKKIASLLFHFSFIIIILGAGITRYFGEEGLMIIKEGEKSNFIYSSDPYLSIKIIDKKNKKQFRYDKKLYMSDLCGDILLCSNNFSIPIDFIDKQIKIKYDGFSSNMIEKLVVHDSIKSSSLELITEGRKSNILSPSEFMYVGNAPIAFEKNNAISPGIEIKESNNEVLVRTDYPISYNPPMSSLKNILPVETMDSIMNGMIAMPDSLTFKIPINKWTPMKTSTRYVIQNNGQFVYNQKIKHAKKMLVKSSKKNNGLDLLKLRIRDHKLTWKNEKKISLLGGMNSIPQPVLFHLNGLDYEIAYGSKKIELPFSVKCIDFKLEKYPGSESPSSFESKLQILDSANNYFKKSKIFMNHVLDYNGYRFFQSSYDLDDPNTPENEEGTRLSVNKDWWGTKITYLGYTLLILGMILSIFSKNGRFKELNKKLNKLKSQKLNSILLVCFCLGLSSYNYSQQKNSSIDTIIVSKEHSKKLASLLVQNYQGRIVPFQTLCNELLRKTHRSDKFNEYNAVQTILSMHMYPKNWFKINLIPVPKAVREKKAINKIASLKDLMNSHDGQFIWLKDYKSAHQKMEKHRNEFDKKIIKLNERYEVLQSIFMWKYMKIIPLKKDAKNRWVLPVSSLLKNKKDASKLALSYFSAVNKSIKSNNYSEAESTLIKLKKYQRSNADKKHLPSESKINAEIFYNNSNIFKRTYQSYLLFGFILLILFFIGIFRSPQKKPNEILKWTRIIVFSLISIAFIFHGLGIGMRWYISGHEPWSNGYEAIVFISWITMIAGFIFSFRNSVIIASTAILASLMIFVTEMNLMDPEITPLVPVLKSYWLMIHVAVITSSYGFLGLSFILGLINFILYIVRNSNNDKRVSNHISELTYVSELSMTIGVFMLTIGTFLGGIWANESWGRYWGWDPKETWALVSILVYAVILHLRFIPALKNKFVFNTVSFWGYSAILFTFFGVNFILVGLHSYAQGDGIAEIPNWIYYTVFFFILLNVFAFYRKKTFLKKD